MYKTLVIHDLRNERTKKKHTTRERGSNGNKVGKRHDKRERSVITVRGPAQKPRKSINPQTTAPNEKAGERK